MPTSVSKKLSASVPLAGVHLKLVAVALAWGGTFIAGRAVADTMPHFTAASIRFLIATACLGFLLHRVEGRRLPTLSLRQWLTTAALGATGVLAYNLAFFGALALMPAGRTALVVALNPVITALAAAVVFRERIPTHRWSGIVLALIGVWVVLTRGAIGEAFAAFGHGELMMFGGVASWAAYTVIGRRLLSGAGAPTALAATTLACAWGTAFLLLGAITEVPRVTRDMIDLRALAALAYLGLIGTALAFVWYYEGVRAIGAARTAVFTNLVPIFGVLLGALLLGEPILPSMLVGGAVAIAGVMLTTRD